MERCMDSRQTHYEPFRRHHWPQHPRRSIASGRATGKAPRRVPQRTRQPLWVVPEMNVVWALDFMRDTRYGGKVFRTLNVIDEANRGALGIDIAASIPAVRVTAFVAQLIDLHGRPQAIRCDNGPLTSLSFTDWCRSQDIEVRFIQPGKPDQNAYIERFNRTYREEILSAYLFESLDQVRNITADWLERYNEIRPHDALGSLPPARYRERLLAAESPG